ncbi:hypothetical protein TNCV_831081 [Trichonephila clavipes]|nr:hypothetical protein TNCV_831081 [Trichonephila clavipes]
MRESPDRENILLMKRTIGSEGGADDFPLRAEDSLFLQFRCQVLCIKWYRSGHSTIGADDIWDSLSSNCSWDSFIFFKHGNREIHSL